MPRTTTTLNPLHFEDLEPHRFEDLIRQLIYDFRRWKSLEATGRAGSDEGIDIRGIELVDETEHATPKEDDDGQTDEELSARDATVDLRLWVVQCKRTMSIGPQKVREIVSDFFSSSTEPPYGYILAAACDFSKAARDAFRAEMLKYHVQEFYIWGKAEIEDQLFLPKNDHLLFAYFGISLQLRRRSAQTRLRSRLALKRRLVKELGPIRDDCLYPILIRDPKDDEYPFIRDTHEFVTHPRWRYWHLYSHQPLDHLAFTGFQHFAYVDWQAKQWDSLDDYDAGLPFQQLSGLDPCGWDPEDKGMIYRAYWERNVPKTNRAWCKELRIIPYDRILLLDEIGDVYNEGPHLLVDYLSDEQPFETRRIVILESAELYTSRSLQADDVTRIPFFPSEIPDERHIAQDEARQRLELNHPRRPDA